MAKSNILITFVGGKIHRDVAQLVARHVRDVEVGSSSLLIPTKKIKIKAVVRSDYCLYCFLSISFLSLLTVRIQVLS